MRADDSKEGTMPDKVKIGEYFVNNGIISELTLQRALEKARSQRKKVGFVLEDMGVITGEELATALANQFGFIKVSNFAKETYDSKILGTISADTAMQYFLFPLRLQDNKLYLAISDPTDTKIVENVAENNNMTIIPVIATRADIIEAINKHYLGKDGTGDSRKSILIADDDVLFTTSMSNILTKAGFKVIVSHDGIDAFKTAISESPHVIVVDKTMPKLGGYELLVSLKSVHETKNIPVILVTCSEAIEEEARAFEQGFFDYIAKPVKPMNIINRVVKAIKAYELTQN